MPEEKKEIIFNYTKTANYRTYYADGFFGGITPKGKIYMEPFVERGATPGQVKHNIKDDGSLDIGQVIEGKVFGVREIECGILIDISTAKSLHAWIGNKIAEFEGMQKKSKNIVSH